LITLQTNILCDFDEKETQYESLIGDRVVGKTRVADFTQIDRFST
jgi:hypothetical protein